MCVCVLFIYVVVYRSILSTFIAKSYPFCECTVQLINGHLGCFQFAVMTTNAAISIFVHEFAHISHMSVVYIPKTGFAGLL